MSLYRADRPARVYAGGALASAVYKGTVEVWRRDPATQQFTPGTTSLVVPTWAALADIGALGGGGGGATGDSGFTTANGAGGRPATWSVNTFTVRPGDTLTIVVGAGGAGGAGGVKKSGSAGDASSVLGNGVSVLAFGGDPGIGSTANGTVTGVGAASVTAGGVTYPGGANVAASQTGSDPGGGGGGSAYKGWGQTPADAGKGGPGRVLIRFRSF